MGKDGMSVGDMLRKLVSFALLIAAVIALIGFFIGADSLIFDEFKNAFDPFSFKDLGVAIYNFMQKISMPLIMAILGLIGLTVD